MSSVASAPAVSRGPAPGPLSRYRFVALGVVWSAYLVVFLSRLCVGPLAPFLKQAFHLDNAQIGGLTSATALAYAPTLLLAGWLVDRIGVRSALVIGALVTGVFVGAVSFAPSYGVMLALLALSGLGCGFIYPSAVKAVMLWFPAHERATAIGFNQAAVNVSGMLGALIMPAVAVAFGWQAGFVVAAALAFVVCGLAVAFYHDPQAPSRVAPGVLLPVEAAAGVMPAAVCEIEQGLPCVTGDQEADRAALRPGFASVARSRDILLLGLAAMFLCMVEFSAMAHLVLFLKIEWAFAVAAAAGLLAVCQGAGALGKPLSGLVSDRLLGRRRRPALTFLAVLSALSCAVLALTSPGHTWLLWVALIGLGAGAGVTAAMDNVGIFIGPPLFGYIVDRTGSYSPAWWSMVAASLAAAGLLLFVREPQRP